MDRREFIKVGAASAAASIALGACDNSSNGSPAPQGSSDAQQGQVARHYEGVSLLGYGCMRWPTYKAEDGKQKIDQQKVNELVDYAISHGVNYFDTAPVYLEGESERATAEALSRYPRSSYLLATKLSNFGDWTYESSRQMFQRSLEIFNTGYVDYYLLHSIGSAADFDRRFASTGIMDYLLKEREQGRIRNLGFSFHGAREGFDELMALHSKYHWDFVQIQMNYVDWAHAGARNTNAQYLYTKLNEMDIPIVIMEPLRGGRLADLPAAISDKMKAREPSRSLSSWAFRFVGSFPRVMCVLSGMTYMEHLEDNVKTFSSFKPLNSEEMNFLAEVADQLESYPLIRCTACQYCMPCPYGLNIPAIFKFYNDNVNAGTYVSSREQEDYARVRRNYLRAYNKSIEPDRQADHCIGCGKCARECPQHIAIPRELRRIDEYIESLKQQTL
ncbi:MAG: aldo/keto reductase [Bacteroidales bacterium]|nr:aldo/keto reductase [Bacteroidales bacterium]